MKANFLLVEVVSEIVLQTLDRERWESFREGNFLD